MILYLVCDTSGSMSEGGCILTVRGIVRATEQYLRLGYGKADLKLIAWSQEARMIEWIPDDEFPPAMLVCEGSANAESLIALLGEHPNGKVLLITDGFWTHADTKALKHWKECLSGDLFRIIKVGAVSNARLKGEDIFVPEDMFAVLDGWLEKEGA